jgi:hypothetical protein
MPDCQNRLFEKSEETDDEIYVGQECHIVARRDHVSIARSVPNLTAEERITWTHLIDDRHGIDNLVLLCLKHAKMVGVKAAGYTVAKLVDIKLSQEQAVAAEDDRERSGRYDDAPVSDGDVRVLLLDDVHEWERASIRELAAYNYDELAWLQGVIGAPSDGDRVEALINDAPPGLVEGSRELRTAVARAAERHGRWPAAAKAWELAASDAEGHAAADLLARGAIAAGQAGPSSAAERERLLGLAQNYADSLRLNLARFNDDGPPEDTYNALLSLTPSPEDLPPLLAQLHLQRARAAMLTDNLPAAEEHFAAAKSADPEGLATQMFGVNVVIQRARVGVRDDRDFPAGDVAEARAEAMRIRERLVDMGRYAESVRMLMLAADAWGVLRDPARARPLLESALDDELATEDGPRVLGDAALRAGQSDLALRFVGGRDDRPSRRIAATARADMLLDPAEPLAELERMATDGGPEAVMAAAARLGACLPPIKAPFSEMAAKVLEASPHSRMAAGIRVLTLARVGRHDDAEKILDGLPKTPWAAELRLRAAGLHGAKSVLRKAADDLLKIGPDPPGRLLAARAFAKLGDLAELRPRP